MFRTIFTWVIIGIMVVLTNGNLCADVFDHPGRKLYSNHDYRAAIDVCRGNSDLESMLVLALSHSELHAIYKQKSDKKIARDIIKEIDKQISFDQTSIFIKYTNLPGTINGNKVAAGLMKTALININGPSQVAMAIDYLSPRAGATVNKSTLGAIRKYLKQSRSYVNKGGTIPVNDRQLLTDTNLLTALFYQLFHRKNDSLAKECFILIENPALDYLSNVDNPKIDDTIKRLNKVINRRLKKMPYSKWYGIDVKLN